MRASRSIAPLYLQEGKQDTTGIGTFLNLVKFRVLPFHLLSPSSVLGAAAGLLFPSEALLVC